MFRVRVLQRTHLLDIFPPLDFAHLVSDLTTDISSVTDLLTVFMV